MLHEIFAPGYCGGFAGGNGPLSSIDTFLAEKERTMHRWEQGMLGLLCEGVNGPQLRMTDLAKAQKYWPATVIGPDGVHTIFRGEQAGSLLCAGFGQLDQAKYMWGNTMAAMLLGGKVRSPPYRARHLTRARAHTPTPSNRMHFAGAKAAGVGRRPRHRWLPLHRDGQGRRRRRAADGGTRAPQERRLSGAVAARRCDCARPRRRPSATLAAPLAATALATAASALTLYRPPPRLRT